MRVLPSIQSIAVSFAAVSFIAPAIAAASDRLAASPDVTIVLSGVTVDDQDVAEDDLIGTVVSVAPPDLPQAADLVAYHQTIVGDVLFSVDTTVVLPGSTIAGPEDVVLYDGVDYSIYFDGTVNAVPDGARVDAVTAVEASGDLLLSFDVSVDFGGFTADDEDLVRWDGVDLTSFFDASAAGVSEALDLDAIHYFDSNGHLGLSFDTSGVIATISFDDEDVLEYDVGIDTWELSFDASAEHTVWSSSDIDALHFVPEPDPHWMLAGGCTLLAALQRIRRRSPLPRQEEPT